MRMQVQQGESGMIAYCHHRKLILRAALATVFVMLSGSGKMFAEENVIKKRTVLPNGTITISEKKINNGVSEFRVKSDSTIAAGDEILTIMEVISGAAFLRKSKYFFILENSKAENGDGIYHIGFGQVSDPDVAKVFGLRYRPLSSEGDNRRFNVAEMRKTIAFLKTGKL